MEYYDLTAASFADRIEVGRSSISHLLSGRNNPSLDLVMKIIKAFPEVELYWLLNGKGRFPSTSAEPKAPVEGNKPQEEKKRDLFSDPDPDLPPHPKRAREISRVVIFYRDGTFEAFEN